MLVQYSMNKVNCINYTDEKMNRMNITILKDDINNYEDPYNKQKSNYDRTKQQIRKQNKLLRIKLNWQSLFQKSNISL